jgi:hypothetical protein
MKQHKFDTVQVVILGLGVFFGGYLTGFYHGTVREMKQCENVIKATEETTAITETTVESLEATVDKMDELLGHLKEIPTVEPVESPSTVEE